MSVSYFNAQTALSFLSICIRFALVVFLNHDTDIRIQQRNNKKTLTTLQGLPNDLDFKRILKAFKKVRDDQLACC
jgi:hypothetical protein